MCHVAVHIIMEKLPNLILPVGAQARSVRQTSPRKRTMPAKASVSIMLWGWLWGNNVDVNVRSYSPSCVVAALNTVTTCSGTDARVKEIPIRDSMVVDLRYQMNVFCTDLRC